MNCELPDVQAGFRKGRGTGDQIANICWIMEKAKEFQKNIYFCFIDYCKNLDSVDHKKLWETIYNKNFYFPREIFPTYLVHSEAFVSISTLPAPLSNELSSFILEVYFSCRQTKSI